MSETLDPGLEHPPEDLGAGVGAGHEGQPDAPEREAPDTGVEARARRMGWLPREEFRGDQAAWRPADEFLERGETILPVLQQQLRSLDGKYGSLQRDFGTYREQAERTAAEMADMLRRADERAHQRALREIEARRNAALEAGDSAAFAAADQERDALRQTASAPPPVRSAPAPPPVPAAPQPAPEVVAWVSANPWFNSDPEAQRDAVALFGQIEQSHAHLPLAERLAMTRSKVARLHPQHFQNPRRDAPAPVGSSTPSAPRAPNPRSFDALPADVKTQYARWARQLEGKGKPLTKDEFASYYWENEA